jgi:hypothetical protein
MNSLGRGGHHVRALGLLALLGLSLQASAATIGAGYSGMWFDPDRSGEGLQLEILDSNTALVEWFTYDEEGGQRWVQGIGQIIHSSNGDSIQFSQVYDTHGGIFGPNFDPESVSHTFRGNLALSFSDCNTGSFHYSAYGQSQTLPIVRLTLTMGGGCGPINGVPGQPIEPYAGQSGSWYDTSHSGEGFELQWLNVNQALVVWYTYDLLGNQIWLLGLGTEQNGAIVFNELSQTSGPHFGVGYDVKNYAVKTWGSLSLQIDCAKGTAHYDSIIPGYGSGDLNLTRLTSLAQPGCPAAPAKFTDLYDVAWEEIPVPVGTPSDEMFLVAYSIASDGTIAARRDDHLTLWHPEIQSWEDIPRDIAAVPVYISPDGSTVAATDAIPVDQSQPLHTLLWRRATDWQPLSGDAVSRSVMYSVSKNFKYLAGNGHNEGGQDQVWVRATDGSQVILPYSDDLPAGIPIAVSNDGTQTVGVALRFDVPDFPQPVAARWSATASPTVLHSDAGEELAVASACNSDCSLVFGAGLFMYDPTHPHPSEPWYLKSDGTFGYFGPAADAPVASRSYGVGDATADGSMVVGSYAAYADVNQPDLGTALRPFIWTQVTGLVSLRSLISELGIGDDDWETVYSLRLSPDGLSILIPGAHIQQAGQLLHSRVVVLHLTQK